VVHQQGLGVNVSIQTNNFSLNLISVLCPTRERPENVLRLVNSARATAKNPELLEFIFYVDLDDESFPDIDGVKVIRGPRVWISNAHNVLYASAKGEILMTAGDDMEFLSMNWDVVIKEKFKSIPDRIGLVFGNDLGTHAGKIAVHGFFHRRWIEIIGTWVQPGRGCPWDLWSTDVARKIDRLFYLPEVHIKHIHYRQGNKEANFDSTYQYVYNNNSSFNPQLTYRLLERERRIDRILLIENLLTSAPFERQYLISSFFEKRFRSHLSLQKRRKLLILRNRELFFLPVRLLMNKFFKFNLKKLFIKSTF